VAATCASCLQPIVRMDQCTISGSEVFHRRCVANIEDSVGNRRQRRVHELTQKLEQAGRTIRQLERTAARAEAAAGESADQLRALMEREVQSAADREAVAAIRERSHEQEIAKLRAERDIARAEAAIATSASAAATTPELDTPDLDDASTRFSLLELDLDL